MSNPDTKEVLEPEVLPPERPGDQGRRDRQQSSRSDFGSLNPVFLGMLIDLLDFATFGPIGIRIGFIVGGLLTALVCMLQGVRMRYTLLMALAAGLYCAFPMTERLPLATLIALFMKFTRSGRR